MNKRKIWIGAALSAAAMALLHVSFVFVGAPVTYLVLQAFVAAGATTFSIVYHVTASWWESAMGRNIMLLVGSIAAILDIGLIFNLAGRPEWMREVFAGLYLAIGVAIWRRLSILIDAQYHSDDHVRKPNP